MLDGMSARIEAGRVAIKTAQFNLPTQTICDSYAKDPFVMTFSKQFLCRKAEF
jgi:hypothetical protein